MRPHLNRRGFRHRYVPNPIRPRRGRRCPPFNTVGGHPRLFGLCPFRTNELTAKTRPEAGALPNSSPTLRQKRPRPRQCLGPASVRSCAHSPKRRPCPGRGGIVVESDGNYFPAPFGTASSGFTTQSPLHPIFASAQKREDAAPMALRQEEGDWGQGGTCPSQGAGGSYQGAAPPALPLPGASQAAQGANCGAMARARVAFGSAAGLPARGCERLDALEAREISSSPLGRDSRRSQRRYSTST